MSCISEISQWGIWATGQRGAAWAKNRDGSMFRGTEDEAKRQAAKWNSRLSGLSTVHYSAESLED
jgi:hypothetical protein